MVRKRSRKYESDDNDSDSDVDFSSGQKADEPAPKKYSLRERKNTSVLTDFDYYGIDDDDGEAKRGSSDDEDFEIEADPGKFSGVVTQYCEPELDTGPQDDDGLIDFEDIIRADIVVNKNKIDYDNLIQKTEIKLIQNQKSEPEQVQSAPKRRGRKPKYQPIVQAQTDSTVTEPPTDDNVPDGDTTDSASHTTKEDVPQTKPDDDQKESVTNGDVVDHVNNGNVVSISGDDAGEVDPPSLPVKKESRPNEEKTKQGEEDDDDVIVLEEKHDVIVLDD